jgi:hypothetical protein
VNGQAQGRDRATGHNREKDGSKLHLLPQSARLATLMFSEQRTYDISATVEKISFQLNLVLFIELVSWFLPAFYLYAASMHRSKMSV